MHIEQKCLHKWTERIKNSDVQIRARTGKYFSYFSSKTYVVGTQKNRLNETVLLSTQNKYTNNYGLEIVYNFTQKIFVTYLNLYY